METRFQELFDNLVKCLVFHNKSNSSLISRTYDKMRDEGIQKISKIIKNKNNSEIKDIINFLEDARKRFYINRDMLFRNSLASVNMQEYVSKSITDILELKNNDHIYIYPFFLVYKESIRHYEYTLLDNVPKYLDCHIKLYHDLIKLVETNKEEKQLKENIEVKTKKEQRKLKKYQAIQKYKETQKLKEEITLPEWSSFEGIYNEKEPSYISYTLKRETPSRKGGKKKRITNKNQTKKNRK